MTFPALIFALPLVGIQTGVGLLEASANVRSVMSDQDTSRPVASFATDGRVDDVQQTTSADPTRATGPASPNGAIVVTARPQSDRMDPLRALNTESFAIVQSIDGAVTQPIAMAYQRTVPAPVRSGLRNVLGNLQEPVVFLNYLLQLKLGKGAETLGRFAINSTIGAAGLFDVAKRRPFNLPHRTNGFAYTLGYYGLKVGPYMYLPLIGPTTLRDLAGRLIDLSVLPFAVGRPFNDPAFVIPTTVLRLVDERAEAEEGMRNLLDGVSDPYATVRTDYLRTRQQEIDALREKTSAQQPAPDAMDR